MDYSGRVLSGSLKYSPLARETQDKRSSISAPLRDLHPPSSSSPLPPPLGFQALLAASLKLGDNEYQAVQQELHTTASQGRTVELCVWERGPVQAAIWAAVVAMTIVATSG